MGGNATPPRVSDETRAGFGRGIREFLRLESAGGLVLLAATLIAIFIENTPLKSLYDALWEMPVSIRIGIFELAKPFVLWINDGLMVVFFFLVGLEVKREFSEGELSHPSRITLPFLSSIGGVIAPAGIYWLFTRHDASAANGWAIPTATDIAFTLGILSLLGNRVPPGLKLFLLTLAIIDDVSAILIIAVFYSTEISWISLGVAALAVGVLYIMNRRRIMTITGYVIVGVVLWVAVLKAGVHATLAGVVLAAFIPMYAEEHHKISPLKRLEQDLHPAVAYGILPVFALANTGIPLHDLSFSALLQPVPLGIAAGLFIGKQIGVFSFAWLGEKIGLGRRPSGVSWPQLYGVAVLSGIGFTMSLFVNSLAFSESSPELIAQGRAGVLAGSVVSAVFGYFLVRAACKPISRSAEL